MNDLCQPGWISSSCQMDHSRSWVKIWLINIEKTDCTWKHLIQIVGTINLCSWNFFGISLKMTCKIFTGGVLSILAILGSEHCVGACTASQLTALTNPEFHIVDPGTKRDRTNRHCIEGSAREYKGHMANDIDTLSRTLRAGGSGPGGGSNTL